MGRDRRLCQRSRSGTIVVVFVSERAEFPFGEQGGKGTIFGTTLYYGKAVSLRD